jgi:hypothetical protein
MLLDPFFRFSLGFAKFAAIRRASFQKIKHGHTLLSLW